MVAQPQSPTMRRVASELHKRAQPIGMALEVVEARDASDLEKILHSMQSRKPDAIWFSSSVFSTRDKRAIELPTRHEIPSIHNTRQYVESGGLISYGENGFDTWRLMGRCVGKILNGAHPRDLPVEQPTQLDLAINLKTAKRWA